MNSAEFLNEVKSSSICPENFEKIYREFQVFQKAALDTMKEIHRVCEKNAVPYQLQYGSLLGFIRDGGQIPWDYDIDIVVPYEEKGNLIAALQKDLDPGFYFRCSDTDPKCRHTIIRVAPVEYNTASLHVDIFFFIGSPEEEKERARYAQRIRKLSNDRYRKLVKIKEISVGNPMRGIKSFIRFKIPTLFTSVPAIDKEYKSLCSAYSSSESTYCISADIFATWYSIPSALLWETKLAQCDCGTFRIPVHYEKLLEMFYGDYRAVPPLESRIQEVVRNHRSISKLKNDK